MFPNINERAKDQEKDRKSGGYADKYFDENETRDGQEKYDLATGNAIANDKDDLPVDIAYISEKDLQENDPIIGELEDDITTKWFLENGFDKLGNKIKDLLDGENKAA